MPVSPRRRRAGGARRDAVLQTVAHVLAERGYENTRFADVSAASGVAISTMQNYFGSREDMLIEAMRHATDVEVLALEAVAAAEADHWNRLVALIDRSLSAPLDVHRLLIEFWRSGIRDAELRDYGEEVWVRYRAPFVTNGGRWQGRRRLRPRHHPRRRRRPSAGLAGRRDVPSRPALLQPVCRSLSSRPATPGGGRGGQGRRRRC